MLILPEHWDKVRAGELCVLVHCQTHSGRTEGLWGKISKQADCGSKCQLPEWGPWWDEGHGPQQQGGSWVRGKRQMSVRWPDHSSQHQSVTGVYVPLKINAMDVNAKMHNTGPLFLLVPPFPSKIPQKDKTLAGLVLGCLHLESLNSLKGQARRFMAYPGTLSSSIWEWDEHLTWVKNPRKCD